MDLGVGNSGQNPQWQQLKAQGKAQPIEKAVQENLKSGQLNWEGLSKLRSEVTKQLGFQPDKLTEEQVKQVDALVADALDGQVDGKSAAEGLDQAFAEKFNNQVQARQEADFSPVFFQMTKPQKSTSEPNNGNMDPVGVNFSFKPVENEEIARTDDDVKPDAPDQTDGPDKTDEPDTPDAPDQTDGPDKTDEPDTPDAPDQTDGPDKTDEPDTPDAPDQTDGPDKTDEPDTPDAPDQTDSPDKTDEPDTPDAPDQTDKSGAGDFQAKVEGFEKLDPAAQREVLGQLLQDSASADQVKAVLKKLKADPALMDKLMGTVTADNLSSKESAAIVALAVDAKGEVSADLKAKLANLKGVDKSVSFYNNVFDSVQKFKLDNNPRLTKEHSNPGVMRRLADAHFASNTLSNQERFDVLMKVKPGLGVDEAKSLLRPLIHSLSSKQKQALVPFAQSKVRTYEANYVSSGGQAAAAAVRGNLQAAGFTISKPEYDRAQLILEILREPGDEIGPNSSQKTPSQPEPIKTNPTVQELPATPPQKDPKVQTDTGGHQKDEPKVEQPVVKTQVVPPPQPQHEDPKPDPEPAPWTEDANLLSKYNTLSKADQDAFMGIYEGLDGSRQQLGDLLKNGTLQKTDTKGQTVLNNLNRLWTGQLHEGVDNKRLTADAIGVLSDSSNVIQGPHGTSGAASLEFMMAQKQPAELLRLVTDLAANGQSSLRSNGVTLKADDSAYTLHRGQHTQGGAETRSDFDVIFQSAVMESVAQKGGDLGSDAASADYDATLDARNHNSFLTGDAGTDPDLLTKMVGAMTGQASEKSAESSWKIWNDSGDMYAKMTQDLQKGHTPFVVLDTPGAGFWQYVAVDRVENGKVYFQDTLNTPNGRSRQRSLSIDDFQSQMKYAVTGQN